MAIQPTGANTPFLTPLQKRQLLEQRRNAQVQHKLSKTVIILMITTAIFLDLAQLGLDWLAIGILLNPIADVVIGLGFYVWFKMHGVNMASVRKALTFIGGIFFSMLLPSIPLWTVDIGLICIFERLEERLLRTAPGLANTLGKVSGQRS